MKLELGGQLENTTYLLPINWDTVMLELTLTILIGENVSGKHL